MGIKIIITEATIRWCIIKITEDSIMRPIFTSFQDTETLMQTVIELTERNIIKTILERILDSETISGMVEMEPLITAIHQEQEVFEIMEI